MSNHIERPVAPGRVPIYFEATEPNRTFADLIVSEATRIELETVLTKIEHHRTLYQDYGLETIDPSGGRTAINLFGPPGTGKTFAAEAIAQRIGKPIIKVNYAELESKFVGDTAKNIVEVFRQAKAQDAVLFFDEADSILGKRLTQVRQSTDHAVNVSRSVMLLQLDEFKGLTIFATNLARNYDPAFVRRIIAHILMPLPGAQERRRLWSSHIPARLPIELSESEWISLVQESDSLSGGDILNCVIYAASRALARDASSYKVVFDDFSAAIEACRRGREAIERNGTDLS